MLSPNFTLYSALAGGILIGIAASLLLWLNGRIAGASGIVGRMLPWSSDSWWRLLFVVGLVAGAGIFYLFWGGAPTGRTEFPAWLLGLAGLLVGYGTSLGNGCTSGHGVCGLGRLSARSLIATVVFLLVGVMTAVMVRHVWGIQ